MKNPGILVLALWAASLVMPQVCLAGAQGLRNDFQVLDASQDGRLSFKEYAANQADQALAQGYFKALDADGDGYLTYGDADRLFKAYDTGKNGSLSYAEYAEVMGASKASKQNFNWLDRKRDGRISAQEWREFWPNWNLYLPGD